MSVSRHVAFRLCLSPILGVDHQLHHSDWVTKVYHIKMMIFIRFIVGSFSRYWWVHNWHPQLLHWADLLQPSGRLQVSLLWLPSTLQESVKHVSQIYIFSPAKVLRFWLRVRFLLHQSMPRLSSLEHQGIISFHIWVVFVNRSNKISFCSLQLHWPISVYTVSVQILSGCETLYIDVRTAQCSAQKGLVSCELV